MDQITSAYQHLCAELGLQNIEASLQAEFDLLQKAHDAIHEFMLLAPLCFPACIASEISWQSKSAFLLYQWEVFQHAHRSLMEALGGYYNVAFILLRTALELLLKGAFWQCLSHEGFREHSHVLETSKQGREIQEWLRTIIEQAPHVKKELDRTSAGIFDKVSSRIEDPAFRVPPRILMQQLEQWGVLQPVASTTLYELYQTLSADVHVVPDKTDIGRRLVAGTFEPFEQAVVQPSLREYGVRLHGIMDIAIVVELNIMQDLIGRFESARSKLAERAAVIEQLELRYTLDRIKELLKL